MHTERTLLGPPTLEYQPVLLPAEAWLNSPAQLLLLLVVLLLGDAVGLKAQARRREGPWGPERTTDSRNTHKALKTGP